MAFNFTGKKVLVTGAGSGVGKGLALTLAEAGADVYALSRQQAHLDDLLSLNTKIHTILADLSDWEATRKALKDLDPMDGLVNNAGIPGERQPALLVSKDNMDKTFAVNLFGAVNVTQIVGAKMVEAGKGGSIVNVSSIGGLNAVRGCMQYNMSKAALDMMTKQFALELGPHNIRVNSVNPTVIMTDWGRRALEGPVTASKLKSHTPLDRFAEVSEVVGPIMYLLSEYSSMVTGTVNPIEGGLLSIISV